MAIEAELLAGGDLVEPPDCPLCRKPCVWMTNASAGGATLGTVCGFQCRDHPSWVIYV